MISTGLFFFGSPTIQKADTNLPNFQSKMTDGSNKHKSIIRLETTDGRFYCSGVVIDGQYALTAAHCAVNRLGNISGDDVAIYDQMGSSTGIIAKAAAIDTLRDVALIRGNFAEFEFAPVDFIGEDSYYGMVLKSCGFPSGDVLYCTELHHIGNHVFQYATIGGPIFKGMSGGPVFNTSTGRVVGVNSAVGNSEVIISPLVGFLSNVGF